MTKITNAEPPVKIPSVAVNMECGLPPCHHDHLPECMRSKLVAIAFDVPEFQPSRRANGRSKRRILQMLKKPFIAFMISSAVTSVFLLCKYMCTEGRGLFSDFYPVAAAPLAPITGLTIPSKNI